MPPPHKGGNLPATTRHRFPPIIFGRKRNPMTKCSTCGEEMAADGCLRCCHLRDRVAQAMQAAINLKFLRETGYPMANLFLGVPEGGEKCDFCNNRPVTAHYDAEDFVMQVVGVTKPAVDLGSGGSWAACSQCEVLIDADDWEGLVNRAISFFFAEHSEMADTLTIHELTEQMWSLYRQLREHKFKKAAGGQ